MPDDRPVILLTGASSGIGKALAETLLARKVVLIATARNIATLADLAPLGAHIRQLDVTDSNACDQLIAECVEQFGRLDMLINNAGFGQMGPLLDVTAEQLQQQFAINLFAPLHLCQLAAAVMTKQNRGCLVNIGSVSGIAVTPFAGAYCASKAALHAMDEALRMELAPFNIRVVTVQPGAIASNFGHTASTRLPASSPLYRHYQAGIIKRAGMSQQNATPAKQFADHVVKQLLQRRGPPSQIRYGRGSRTLPIMVRWLPPKLRYAILSKVFGLDKKPTTTKEEDF